jgi:hypothetical protein
VASRARRKRARRRNATQHKCRPPDHAPAAAGATLYAARAAPRRATLTRVAHATRRAFAASGARLARAPALGYNPKTCYGRHPSGGTAPRRLTRAAPAATPQALFVLYEAASGYALFEALDADEIAQNTERMQEAIKCARRAAAAAAAAAARAAPKRRAAAPRARCAQRFARLLPPALRVGALPQRCTRTPAPAGCRRRVGG